MHAIIQSPVAAQHPDLAHFRPVAAAGGAPGDGGRGGGGGRGTTAPASTPRSLPALIAVAASVALLAALLALAWRRTPQGALRRIVLTPLLAALLLATAAAVSAAAGSSTSPHTATSGASTAASSTAHMPVSAPDVSTAAVPRAVPAPGALLSALRGHALVVPVGAASRTWTSLVSIETALTTEHDRALTDEQQIAELTQRLATGEPPLTPAAMRRPLSDRTVLGALQQVVDDHQTALAAYNAGVQNEYSFYVSVARSPEASAELDSVAAHTPPQVHSAVATDLGLVQTQLEQEAQIAAAESAAAATPPASVIAGSTPSGPISSEALAQRTAIHFHAPVGGVVTQLFGPTEFSMEPPVTYAGVFYPHFHTGLDIASPLDTPVGASAAGTVILATSSVDAAGHLSGYGNYVVIAHGGGFTTLYGHLDKLLVTTGEPVQQGQVIGLLGSTGWSTGPHVHFEIRTNGVYVDPAPFLAAQPTP